ncbi:MAG TPA: hypothetical protein VGN54_14805 [Mycobacteriales bacterium]|nr:hypothetical protein [Mycobacteriales bacterium]
MTLSRRAAGFLLVVAAWTAFVWVTLVRNIAGDHLPTHGTAFHAVHYVLAAIALALDLGVAWIGWRGWRTAGGSGRSGRSGRSGGRRPPAGAGAR